MKTIQVKICGLTNLEDALTAAMAGADFLGFIFYPPSKRAITPEAAQPIIAQLRQLPHCPKLVGVFVNDTAERMSQVLEQCQLDLAQLSGEEVPSLVNDPQSPLYGRAFKALRPQSIPEAEADAEWYVAESPAVTPSLLLDAYHPTLKGGTGEVANWEMARHLVAMSDKLMLAGGLTPANVAQAVQEVKPFAVDVASGVEASPGRKNPQAVQEFIRQAKSVSW
jgi:phosphoribosylanthranilate isomerase